MHISSVLLVALISARVNAVPLNINLGAYSPALVVGDGEISFKGKEEVSELMDALEGAAVSGAAKNGASTLDGTTAADTTAPEGLGVPEKAPTSSFPAQGLGKIIAPRSVHLSKRDEEKRDINGFNAALNYASEALGKGPLVELSTGPKGSGVGVRVQPKVADTVKAGLAPAGVPAKAPAAAGAKNGLGRRDDSQSPKTKTTVTTMFVRGGPRPDSVEGSETKDLEKRSTPNEAVENNLNLKVADGELAELTFVETRSVDETTNNEE
ncbi:hypothetical protein GcM3_165011 [Golovinomyces cichoracearum]|uniref:CSEP0039 effector protein n=1 Tax=Golovinomyces cichoracearum TaxID=62708 RepID=A0A420HSQ0_9PEZI|nr:hypothetical protein GcM3_165011 [Golovinomyces cichoracearum]